ncbi:MAG: penicillin-binding protein [Candidatus Doudnabacteria bacterium]|nr:penicillin-binding protein [Candidatus Doudnabacteria bacterium]
MPKNVGPAKSRLQLAAENSPRAQIRSKFEKFFATRKKMSPTTKKKLKKVLLALLAVFCFVTIAGGLWFFAYIQKLDAGIKSIDDIFRERELASVFYDRKGKELYKLFNNYNRDPLNIEDIPPLVKWAFLASEDIDFYNHQGFDPIAIVRCAVLNLRSGAVSCGGSTITQQIVKIQTNQDQPTVDRKLQEILAAIKVEQAYSKDEILELYLQVIPFGSNIYGLTSASEFYFGKQPKDLTLAEAAILAGMIQNPTYYSPTIGGNTEEKQKRIKSRQENHVLNQLRVHRDQINSQYRQQIDDQEADDLVTPELIDEAIAQQITYREPIFTTKKAGHAVDYALELLQQRNYNNGEKPFELTELQNGGYKIYLTLDYDLQQVAERTVLDAVSSYGQTYAFRNAALMTTVPSTGQIITMVGSRSYFEKDECINDDKANCLFNAQVNVLTSLQSPGSSTKPMGTYEAYRQGLVFPASLLPDVPIDPGGGYTIKNWNGTYFGVSDKTTVGQMLRESRNLPAIVILEMIGTERFLDVMREFGYTTYKDNSQYGPSVILGGADVKPVEHAQGYGVFATGGNLLQSEIIYKITDREGNVVYEHKPEPKKVGDERAAYLINQTLLNNHLLSWDGRDNAAKSGTSENSTDAWIANWSPDYVTIAWIGNNNNQYMDFNAFGENAVSPWVKDYMAKIGGTEYFAAATPFPRPGGIIDIPGCGGECLGGNVGLNAGLRIGLEGAGYPVDNTRAKVRVCVDQTDRLARPIDEALGKATDLIVTSFRMPAPSLQGFLDKYLAEQKTPNGGPTEQCNIDRTGGGINGPFFQNVAVTSAGGNVRYTGNVYSTGGAVTNVEFYFDCNAAANCTAAKRLGAQVPTNNAFDQTFALPGALQPGTYTVMLRATDGTTTNFSSPVQVTVGTLPTATFTFNPASPLVWTAGAVLDVTVTLSAPMTLNTMRLFSQANGGAAVAAGNPAGGPTVFVRNNWPVPDPGAGNTVNYTFYMTGNITGTTTGTYTTLVSPAFSVTRP